MIVIGLTRLVDSFHFAYRVIRWTVTPIDLLGPCHGPAFTSIAGDRASVRPRKPRKTGLKASGPARPKSTLYPGNCYSVSLVH